MGVPDRGLHPVYPRQCAADHGDLHHRGPARHHHERDHLPLAFRFLGPGPGGVHRQHHGAAAQADRHDRAAVSGSASLPPGSRCRRTKLYRIVELVGRWSMLDIYVVAILAALVQIGALATINAGPAALAFGAVVVLTMFAAMEFDPRLIWDPLQKERFDHE